MGADVPVPKQVFAHGFITVEGQKISKSLGNVIDPNALVEAYGSDAVRFYLMAATPFDQDGDFSRKQLIDLVNASLANNIGNLLNRVMKLLTDNCEGKVPAEEPDNTLREQANSIHVEIEQLMSRMEFAKTIDCILALADQANKYFADEKPWALFKEGKTAAGRKTLYTVLEVLRRTAIELYPFTPKMAQAMWHQLGYSGDLGTIARTDLKDAFFDMIPAGQAVRPEGPVFKRIEDPDKEK